MLRFRLHSGPDYIVRPLGLFADEQLWRKKPSGCEDSECASVTDSRVRSVSLTRHGSRLRLLTRRGFHAHHAHVRDDVAVVQTGVADVAE